MEYSKILTYAGNWKNGLRHGLGKVDLKDKSIKASFEDDIFL